MQRGLMILATLGPIGKLPAPGTAGSFAALFMGYWLLQFGWLSLFFGTIAVCIIGIHAADAYERATGKKDASEVIIDEVAGQWIALLALPTALEGQALLIWFLAAFALFRFFDILKPGPVRKAEAYKGGWGVMADDIVAGILAAGILLAARIALF